MHGQRFDEFDREIEAVDSDYRFFPSRNERSDS